MDRSLKLPDVRCGVGRFLFIGSKVPDGMPVHRICGTEAKEEALSRFRRTGGKGAEPFSLDVSAKRRNLLPMRNDPKTMPDIPAEGEGISKKPPKPGNEGRTAKAGRSAENRPVRQHAPRPRLDRNRLDGRGKSVNRRRHSSLAGGNSGSSVGKTLGGRRPFPILKMPFPRLEGSEPTAGKRPRRRRGACPRQIFPRKTRGTSPSFPQFLLLG
ncbi:MAG: hypothetical protein C6W56_09390 [Caldibacillus debilis]|nr:MAG: hypothetical protein C6W56_09390 [Caldibacillus debilis]